MTATISSSQALLLQTLIKAPDGLTTPALAKKSGVGVNSGNIGPVFSDVLSNYPESLHAKKLVKIEKREDGAYWKITKAGEKMALMVKARKRATSHRVPADVLNSTFITFSKTRTYGIEAYTTADLTEFRASLGDDYANVSPEDLREQLINQRKRGAFTDPKKKVRIAVERTIRDFGPDGEIDNILTANQVEELRSLVI